VGKRPQDEPGGYPFTGQAVPGIQATRAQSAAVTWNVGRQAPTRLLAGVPVARGSAHKRPTPRGAEYRRVGLLADLLVVVLKLL